MKELTPILFFQEILSSKRPHLNEAQKAIQAYLKISFNGGPYRKILMINTLIQFISTALSRYLNSLEKLKFNVFYSSSKTKEQQTTKRKIKTKRQNQRRKTKQSNPNLTMNEILQRVVCDQLEQQQNSLLPQKVRNQQNMRQSNIVDIPPFEQDVILQLTQKIHSEIDSLVKQEDIPKWEPSKLENYKNWLALTQNGIDPPKNKRVQKTKKKSNPSLEVIFDRKIDISQGIDQQQMIDQLHTKLKSSKSNIKKIGLRLDQKVEQLAPFIVDSENFVNQISNKFRKIKRNHHKIFKETLGFRQPSVSFSPLQELQQNHLINNTTGNQRKFINNELEKYLETELIFAKKLALKDVANSKKFSNSSLGDIFYDILHCNYPLRQAEPSEFGEILILAS